jgi:hypothetical protein
MFHLALLSVLLILGVSPAHADNIYVTGGSISASNLGTGIFFQGPNFNLGGGDDYGSSLPQDAAAGSLMSVWVNQHVVASGTLLGTSYPVLGWSFCSVSGFTCPGVSFGGFASFTTPTDELLNVTLSVPITITYGINAQLVGGGSFSGSTTGTALVPLFGSSCFQGWCYHAGRFDITLASNVPEPSALILLMTGTLILWIWRQKRALLEQRP